MKKKISAAAIIFILAIGVAILALWTSLDGLVKNAIEKYGSEALRTNVRVSSVSLKITKGIGKINNITVANPTGFSQPNIFSLHNISLHLDIHSLSKKVITLNELAIDSPEIYFSVNKAGKTNMLELQKNMKMANTLSSKKPNNTSSSKTVESSSETKRIIIKKLIFTHAKIQVDIAPLNKHYPMTIPSIVLTNIGGTKGAMPKELGVEIGTALTQKIMKTVGKSVWFKSTEHLSVNSGMVQKMF